MLEVENLHLHSLSCSEYHSVRQGRGNHPRAASNQPGHGQVRRQVGKKSRKPCEEQGIFLSLSNAPWALYFLPAGLMLMGLPHSQTSLSISCHTSFPNLNSLEVLEPFEGDRCAFLYLFFFPLIYFLTGLAREESLKPTHLQNP